MGQFVLVRACVCDMEKISVSGVGADRLRGRKEVYGQREVRGHNLDVLFVLLCLK